MISHLLLTISRILVVLMIWHPCFANQDHANQDNLDFSRSDIAVMYDEENYENLKQNLNKEKQELIELMNDNKLKEMEIEKKQVNIMKKMEDKQKEIDQGFSEVKQ